MNDKFRGLVSVWVLVKLLMIWQAGTRFTEDELHDILTISQGVFDEEEAEIPAGVEDMRMDKIANKLLGAKKIKKRAVGRKKAWRHKTETAICYGREGEDMGDVSVRRRNVSKIDSPKREGDVQKCHHSHVSAISEKSNNFQIVELQSNARLLAGILSATAHHTITTPAPQHHAKKGAK
jgi:hypothetical protein